MQVVPVGSSPAAYEAAAAHQAAARRSQGDPSEWEVKPEEAAGELEGHAVQAWVACMGRWPLGGQRCACGALSSVHVDRVMTCGGCTCSDLEPSRPVCFPHPSSLCLPAALDGGAAAGEQPDIVAEAIVS